MPSRTLLLTVVAMFAFAANSLLCRLALGAHLIDAASFTSIRLVSGAITLALIGRIQRGSEVRRGFVGSWKTPLMLFAYMICFSLAYLSLAAGTGALILFGAVQLTMFVSALRQGEHYSRLSWVGLVLAISGLVYLVLPGLTAPDPVGALLMGTAGIAWGFYSLLGRGLDPLPATTRNFWLALPPALVTSFVFMSNFDVTAKGAALAVVSGALTSACGYVIWYAALKHLTATLAATVQLSVPAIAAIGGALLLSEPLSARLVLASAAIFSGVAIVLAQRAALSAAPKGSDPLSSDLIRR